MLTGSAGEAIANSNRSSYGEEWNVKIGGIEKM